VCIYIPLVQDTFLHFRQIITKGAAKAQGSTGKCVLAIFATEKFNAIFFQIDKHRPSGI
jgi:hypothetical protein